MEIRLGHDLASLRPTLHNGPGWRINVWTQGCLHPCTDQCLNPHFLDPRGGRRFAVRDVVQALRRAVDCAASPVEGITVLGGEPFDQAGATAEMLCGPRQEGLTSVVYTGYVYERLLHADQPDVRRLLDETDVLVDGPYLPHLYDDTLAWRGSSNQRLLCLSDRYTLDDLADAFSRQKKGFSIQIGPGTISLSGVQTRDAALVGEEIVDNLGESANNGT